MTTGGMTTGGHSRNISNSSNRAPLFQIIVYTCISTTHISDPLVKVGTLLCHPVENKYDRVMKISYNCRRWTIKIIPVRRYFYMDPMKITYHISHSHIGEKIGDGIEDPPLLKNREI